MVLAFWRTESKMGFVGLESRRPQVCIPSGGCRAESIALSFPSSLSCLPFSASSIFKAGECITVITSLLLPIPPPSPLASFLSFKDPGDYVDPIWIIRDDLPSTESLTSPHLQNPFAIQGNRFTGFGDEDVDTLFPFSPSCTSHLQEA